MINSGFIKIDRKITEWRWYGDANTIRVFLHLLLIANYEDKPFEKLIIRRGEAVISYPKISNKLKLSIQQARTAIEHLKSTGEITVKPYSKFSVVTITNYDRYQTVNRQNNRQSTGNQQARQQSINNNGRNIRKNTTYSKRNKEDAAASIALSGKKIEQPPEGVVFPEGITNMADYLKYLEE